MSFQIIGEKTRFQLFLLKKKKKIKYVTYISNHVLVVLQNLLHLIKKISKEEGVFNIPILYMRAPKIRGINEVPSK